MARTHLVIGAARSGKSRLAEALAAQRPPVVYLATAQPGDDEMRERIRLHRERRAAAWTTIETPRDVADAIAAHGTDGTILVECVTLWISNHLLATPQPDAAEIRRHVDTAIAAARSVAADVVWVTNEVGSGIVPDNPLARHFRDVLGETNQRLAAAADTVTLSVAGIGVKLK